MSAYENLSLLDKAEVLGKIRDEAIDHLARRLMETKEFNPFTPANLAEAFSEMDENGINALCNLLSDGETEAAGMTLDIVIRSYWESAARLEAMDRIRNQLAHACVRCGGIGCIQCAEDDAVEESHG